MANKTTSPRAGNDRAGKTRQAKENKGQEVIYAIREMINYGNYNTSDVDNKIFEFLGRVLDGEMGADFTAENFEPYHVFLFHEQTKARFTNIFFTFITDCIHKANQVKPIELIQYQAYLSGVERLLVSLDEVKVRRYEDFLAAGLTHRERAMNALADFVSNAKLHFLKSNEVIKRHRQGTKTVLIKESFRNKIIELAEIFQIPFSSQEKKDNVLAGKIIKYLNIKETEADD